MSDEIQAAKQKYFLCAWNELANNPKTLDIRFHRICTK